MKFLVGKKINSFYLKKILFIVLYGVVLIAENLYCKFNIRADLKKRKKYIKKKAIFAIN